MEKIALIISIILVALLVFIVLKIKNTASTRTSLIYMSFSLFGLSLWQITGWWDAWLFAMMAVNCVYIVVMGYRLLWEKADWNWLATVHIAILFLLIAIAYIHNNYLSEFLQYWDFSQYVRGGH